MSTSRHSFTAKNPSELKLSVKHVKGNFMETELGHKHYFFKKKLFKNRNKTN